MWLVRKYGAGTRFAVKDLHKEGCSGFRNGACCCTPWIVFEGLVFTRDPNEQARVKRKIKRRAHHQALIERRRAVEVPRITRMVDYYLASQHGVLKSPRKKTVKPA